MATETSVNGNYAPHQGYGSIEQNHAGYSSSATHSQPSFSNAVPSNSSVSANNAASEIPKDEVGWYFVEQYYTTLSRSPEKLYLFYNKRSQFVSGNETEKIAVCVGQKAINDRIKDLDYQDCKVRVTNVDSQASDEHIVIQVIGEISNKSAPHKKFTQTFVLAGQTNGYFVLNDIFRYIVEEEDEAEAENIDVDNNDVAEEPASVVPSSQVEEPTSAAAEEEEPKTLTSSEDPVAIENDAAKVDQKLEEKVLAEPQSAEEEKPVSPPPAAVNGDSNVDEADLVHAEEAPVAATSAPEEAPETPAEEASAADESLLQEEAPKDPEPTPAMSPVKQAPAKPATPAAAPKPAAPKTWANLAAAAHRVKTPAVAVPQQASSAAPAQPKATPAPSAAASGAPATSAAPSPAPAAATSAREPSPAASQQDEWTSVGSDNKRQQSKAQAGAGAQEGSQNRAYIKNVHDGIDSNQLKALLEKFGEIVYFDIAKQKNCAFVDFKTAEGYKAAIDANPHTIGNERLVVEERRIKPGSYPYVPRGGMRGGRGAPNQNSGRGSFQGGRGNFPQRGRGGNASRARGGAPAS